MTRKHEAETTKIETTIRLAQVIDQHDKSTETERWEVFQEAQVEGVSTLDFLRTHLLLEITNGNAPLVGVWLSEFEFGDFSDNYEALIVSQHRVENGEIEQGLTGLFLLREHIIQSKEIKSFRHLLPVINKRIADVKKGLLPSPA